LPRDVMWYNAPSYSIRKGLAIEIEYHIHLYFAIIKT